MYCILVTGIPAAGKSTMAKNLSTKLGIPSISKDDIKEQLFDTVGFQSRAEKVNLGVAAMEIMYYMAEQLMKCGQSFILENNFENSSKEGLLGILEKYNYSALTVTLTGDYATIYRRFCERNISSERHRGHVVNDCYPEKIPRSQEELKAATLRFEDYCAGIKARGFDTFQIGGKQLVVDVTDFSKLDMDEICERIEEWIAVQ